MPDRSTTCVQAARELIAPPPRRHLPVPDGIPVISAVPELPGLVVATGFSGHGFGIGPGAGRLVADLVTGAAPLVDPAPFRWSRFQGAKDGPRIVQGVAGEG